MPTPLIKPVTIPEPFAINGQKNTIPTTTVTPGAASLDQGFPALTMTPVQQGGVPPSGKDFNGIFNWITQHLSWINAGGIYTFDATLAAFIGGYPVGMVLQSNNGLASYVNVVANNSADFNTDPSQIGVSWMPYGGLAVAPSNWTTIATTGGTTILSNTQATYHTIRVAGALTSDATLVFPNSNVQAWTIINATTGGFALRCAPSGGTSVSILQGEADVIISDGVKMRYGQAETPTQAPGDNSVRLANTAFVTAAITAAITAALVNTALTGNPTAPTPPVNNNSTRIATTAYADRAAANIGAGTLPVIQTANFTAASTGDYWFDTTAGAFTMTLPDPPAIGGNPLRIADIAGYCTVNPVTINAGTKTILGDSTLRFDISGEVATYLYYSTILNDWRLA